MKMFSKVFNILTWVVVIAAILLALLLVGVRLFGFTPYYIQSGSMTPAYQVYDLVYVKHIDPESVNVGDAISFVVDESLTVATHRVVEVDRENRLFYTKGDANDFRDGAVLYENYLGVVKFSIPKLGKISELFGNKQGKYIAIIAVAFVVLLLVVSEIIKPNKKKSAVEDGKSVDTEKM